MRRENLLALILLTAVGFIAYRNCFDIFIPADNYTQFYFFDKGFAAGFLESARSAAPYLSGLPFLYLLYLLLGASPAGWVLTCLLLHITNSFIIFLIAKRLTNVFSPQLKFLSAFFSAVLFLLSPYQAETVLWGTVGARWLFHSLNVFAGIFLFLLYLEKPTAKKLYFLHLLFLIALFSNETALVIPAIYILLYFTYKFLTKTTASSNLFFTRIISIQAGFILALFVFTKLYMGHWFWHGGTIEHITGSSGYIKTLIKYFAKFFLLYRYLPNESMNSFLRILSKNNLYIILLFCSGSALLFFILRHLLKAKKETGYLLSVSILCFVVSLLPALPLDSSFLSYDYPDRYGYIASAFFYIFISFGIFTLPGKFAVPIISLYAAAGWIFLYGTISLWHSSNEYCHQLIKNYSPYLKYDHVYVLNEPAYFKGVVALRSDLRAAVYYAHDHSPVDKIRIVSGCYQESLNDSLISVKVNGQTVEVNGQKKSTPHFCTTGWAKTYSTDEYDVIFDLSGCSYVIKFKKEIPPNSAFIYAVKGNWKKTG